MSLQPDVGQPLTRRQLREMERAAELASVAPTAAVPLVAPPVGEPVPPVEAPAAPVESVPLVDEPGTPVEAPGAPVEAPGAPVGPVETAPAAAPAHQVPEPDGTSFGTGRPMSRRELRALLRSAPDSAEGEDPVDPRGVGRKDGSASAALRDVAQSAIPTGSESVPVVSEQRPPAPAEPASHAPEPFNPPTGHWSLALDDDPETTAETTSGAATSANSLIIDVIPSIADVTAPLASTGEILVTGSIDLTRALGATGQIPSRFDGSAVDEFGDDDTAVVSTNDVVPVSAARAVSSHISVLPSVAPPKAQNPHLPVILGSTAGALAVVVAGILVSAFVFHVF